MELNLVTSHGKRQLGSPLNLQCRQAFLCPSPFLNTFQYYPHSLQKYPTQTLNQVRYAVIKSSEIEHLEIEHPVKAFGWAARDSSGILSPFSFSRRYMELNLVTSHGKRQLGSPLNPQCRQAFLRPSPFLNTFQYYPHSLQKYPTPTLNQVRYAVIKSSEIEHLEIEHPVKAFGWAARDSSGILSPFSFSRRETKEEDVRLKVLYCGICHSDLHKIKNDWRRSIYPMVPGHEIVGIVTEVGMKVKKFKVGDKVGVGCLVGSCSSCENCHANLENYCPKTISTYNTRYYDGTLTYGGFSDSIIVNEHFIIQWPENLALDAGVPLLCAGITVYSSLKYYGLNKSGLHLGVVGLGGLGHVAVKFAKAFGAKVTVISTSLEKKEKAINDLGADSFLVSGDEDQMKDAVSTMDGIIDTVSAHHPLEPLLALLKPHGKLVLVGLPNKPLELPAIPLVMGRKMVAGSMIGGIKETQEMIDFAAENNITADVEVVPMDYVNTAMKRLEKADVEYRFVIDVANTLKSA